MVSYYEWLQNKRSERWDLEEVERRLEAGMKRTYAIVRDYAEEKKIDFRTASYSIGARSPREGVLRARHLPVVFVLPLRPELLDGSGRGV